MRIQGRLLPAALLALLLAPGCDPAAGQSGVFPPAATSAPGAAVPAPAGPPRGEAGEAPAADVLAPEPAGRTNVFPPDAAAFLRAERLLCLATQAASRGDVRAESGLLDRAVDACPEHKHARYRRGLARLAVHAHAAAERDFDAALRADAGYPDPYDDRALARWRQGRRALALEDLSAGARLRSDMVTWYCDNDLGVRTTEDAYLRYSEVLRRYPDDLVARMRLVASQYHLADMRLAETNLPALLERASEHPPIHLLAAFVHAKAGRRGEMRRCLLDAVAADPRLVGAWTMLAESALGAGEVDEALRCTEAALRHDPSCAAALTLRGVALLLASRPGEALVALDAAIDADPSHLPFERPEIGRLAGLCAAAGSLPPASRHVLRGLLEYARDGVWGSDAGVFHCASADAELRRARDLWPRSRVVTSMYAKSRQTISASTEALAWWTETLAVGPAARALNNRAVVAIDSKRYDDALEDLRAASLLAPAYHQPYQNRGVVHGQRGEYRLALLEWSRCVYLRPDRAEGYSGRAWVLEQMADAEWAEADRSRSR